MDRKKVIIIGSAWPLRGGLSNFNERMARAFIQAGYETSILTFSLQYPSILFPGKTQYSSEPKPEDLNIQSVINSVNPINWWVWGRKIKQMSPDLVVMKFWIPFIGPCLGSISRIIRKNRKTKVITIVDNLIPHEKRLFDKVLSNYFSKSVDGFAAMSRSVFQQIKSINPDAPRIFSPHPVYDNFGDKMDKQLAREALQLKSDGRYILFFGFIRDYKGLDLLLEAMANKRIKDQNIKLLVAGEFYTDAKPYQQIIEKHQLQDSVVMHTDFIPDSEVAKYFSAADLVVQPYKDATQSGVTQIAYHFEVPMVITNVGGLAEFVPHEKVGYIVEPNPDKIAEAILRFFNLEDQSIFQVHLKEEKKKYCWEYFVNHILELHQSLNTRNSLSNDNKK